MIEGRTPVKLRVTARGLIGEDVSVLAGGNEACTLTNRISPTAVPV